MNKKEKSQTMEINSELFKNFLDAKEENLLNKSNFQETNIYRQFRYLRPADDFYRYVFVYDKKDYLTIDSYIEKEKEYNQKLQGLDEYTASIPVNKTKESLLKLLIVEVYQTFLILKVFSPSHFEYETGYDSWRLVFYEENVQILHYKSLDLVFKKNGRNKFAKEVRLGFNGFGGTGLDHTIFKGLPLFYAVEDFERDKKVNLPTTITYGDLLRAQRDGLSRKEILQKHLKNASKLENVVNVNKFSVTEAYTLIKMATEFDDKSFVNFVKWFREKGRFIQPPNNIPYSFKNYRTFYICIFILDVVGEYDTLVFFADNPNDIKFEDYYITAKDYVRMCRDRRRKLNINFSSMRKLEENHDKLYASIQNKLLKEENSDEPFEIHEEYKPLIKAVKKRNNPFKYLSKPIDLIIEGNKMHHCVGSYIYSVRRGDCVIVSVVIDQIRYTLEIEAVMKEHEIAGYHLAQMQSIFNGGVKKQEHEDYVISFLNNISLVEENAKKSRFKKLKK